MLEIIRQECPNLAERRSELRYRVAPMERLFHGSTKAFWGNGHIAGQGAGLLTVNGAVARRRIIVIETKTNLIVRQVWSNNDGTYLINNLDETKQYHVIAVDDAKQYEPVGWSFITPCTN